MASNSRLLVAGLVAIAVAAVSSPLSLVVVVPFVLMFGVGNATSLFADYARYREAFEAEKLVNDR